MDRVLIWGTGSTYDKYVANWVNRKEVEVVAFVSGEVMICNILDGKPIICPEDIHNYNYDYIIVASKSYKVIRDKAVVELKIPCEKLINGKVVKHPCFCWERYKSILNNKITLISEACYGGYIYNQLGMCFNSPFINTRIEEHDYLKLLSNLDYYLSKSISFAGGDHKLGITLSSPEISWGKMGYPIFMIEDIKLHAIHAIEVSSYYNDWIRRSKRINLDNMLVMMIIENDDIASRFAELKLKNKIGFYYKETECNDIVCLKEWNDQKIRLRSGYNFFSYVHHLFWDESFIRYIDIFKLLNGESDFLRMY